MSVVVIRHSIAATSESSINASGFNLNFEHEVVSDNSSADFLSGREADLHGTDRWWSRIGDGSGRGQHGNIEADGDGFFGRVVDTANLIGLSFECHQLWMFLDHQDERSFSVNQIQTARAEADFVVDATSVPSGLENSATRFVFRVTLDVENAVESRSADVYVDLDTISQTVDDDIRAREVRTEWWRFRHATALDIFEGEARDAVTLGFMIERRTFGIGMADNFRTRRYANRDVAVFVIWAIGVSHTFRWYGRTDANAGWA